MGIRTIIMAGGRGRRLAPLTDFIPKPLVTVANAPLLGITIDHLVQMGFDDVDISVGYMADKICDYVGRNYKTGIRTHKEKEPRGTAGCVRDVPRTKHGDTLVVSGDILFDLDLSRAVDFHAGSGAAATVVLTRKSDPCRYGTVTLGPSGIITGFREKPEWKNVNSDLVSTGIYVVSDEVLKMIPGKGECDFARDVFPHLVGHGLYGIELDGYWNDVGTPEDYRTANLDAATGKVDSVEKIRLHDGSVVAPDASVSPSANISGCVIMGGATIGDGVHACRAIVGAGAKIGDRCTLYPSSCVAPDAVLPPDTEFGDTPTVTGQTDGTMNVRSAAHTIGELIRHGAQECESGAMLDFDFGRVTVECSDEHTLVLRAEADNRSDAALSYKYAVRGISVIE